MSFQVLADLTEQDVGAGFQVQEIDNPDGRPVTPPRRVWATAFQPATDPSERVVKVHDPATKQVEYHRQIHGVWMPVADGDVPAWKLVGRHADPSAAVAPGAREADLARLGRSVVPSPPPVARQHGA